MIAVKLKERQILLGQLSTDAASKIPLAHLDGTKPIIAFDIGPKLCPYIDVFAISHFIVRISFAVFPVPCYFSSEMVLVNGESGRFVEHI